MQFKGLESRMAYSYLIFPLEHLVRLFNTSKHYEFICKFTLSKIITKLPF
jgi:hypothetical protein